MRSRELGIAGMASVHLLKQAVVPHHPIACLVLLHQHQACLRPHRDLCVLYCFRANRFGASGRGPNRQKRSSYI